MKASTLIAQLTALVAEYGDGNIFVDGEYDNPYVTHVIAGECDDSTLYTIQSETTPQMELLRRWAA